MLSPRTRDQAADLALGITNCILLAVLGASIHMLCSMWRYAMEPARQRTTFWTAIIPQKNKETPTNALRREHVHAKN